MSEWCVPPQQPYSPRGRYPVPSPGALPRGTVSPGHQNPSQSSSPLHQSFSREQRVIVSSRLASFFICHQTSKEVPSLPSHRVHVHVLSPKAPTEPNSVSAKASPKRSKARVQKVAARPAAAVGEADVLEGNVSFRPAPRTDPRWRYSLSGCSRFDGQGSQRALAAHSFGHIGLFSSASRERSSSGIIHGIIITCSHHLSHHATDDSKTISGKSSCPALVLLQGPRRPHASRPRCYLHFHTTADPVAMPKPMFDGADPIRIFFKSSFNEKNLFFSAWSAGTAAKARITKAN